MMTKKYISGIFFLKENKNPIKYKKIKPGDIEKVCKMIESEKEDKVRYANIYDIKTKKYLGRWYNTI